jgi:WD40 repeat protein
LKSSDAVFAACLKNANLRVFSKSLEAVSRTLKRDITGIQLQRFSAHADTIYSISISHDGSQLATASEDNTVKIWDITHGRAVWAAVFSHGGEKLATCCDGGTVRVWDLATGKNQVLLKGEGIPVYAVAFTHSCNFMAVASGGRPRPGSPD